MVKNDFIKKYFTCLSKIFVCVAFAFLLVFSFGQNDIKKSFAYENDVFSYSAFNELNYLVGSKWRFKNVPDLSFFDAETTLSVDVIFSDDTSLPADTFLVNGYEQSYIQAKYNADWLGFDYGVYSYIYTTFPIYVYDEETEEDIEHIGWLDNRCLEFEVVSFPYEYITDESIPFYLEFFSSSCLELLYSPVVSYDITINLDNGIYGDTSATIQENSILTLDYSVIDNDVFSGYVFDYGQSLITGVSGHGHISVNGDYEKISITISDVTEDFEFTIHSIAGRSLVGQWYLDYDLFIASGLNSIDVDTVLSRPFISNDVTYNRIYRTTNFNSFAYENTEDFELPIVNVFSFLNGLYLPVNTYNYLLIDIDYDENYINYVPADYMFFNFFRLATNEDKARVNQFNEQLVIQKENTNFVALFGAILDAQFGTLKSLLNFYIFDINVWSIVTFFLTMALIYIVVKLCKGGVSDDKKK